MIIEDALIIARLKHRTRQGEEVGVEEVLKPFFSKIFCIKTPGFIEGGDVLLVNNHLYIGLSTRTNRSGAEQLACIAKQCFGYDATFLEVPPSLLHLKGGVTYHRASLKTPDVITVTQELAVFFEDVSRQLIVIPQEEHFGANGISDSGKILIHEGRPQTKKALEDFNFCVHDLPMSEFEKIDGALSCLSKLFQITKPKKGGWHAKAN